MLRTRLRLFGRPIPPWALVLTAGCLLVIIGLVANVHYGSARQSRFSAAMSELSRRRTQNKGGSQDEIDNEIGPPLMDPKDQEVPSGADARKPSRHPVVEKPGQKCPPKFGKVIIFVAVVTESYKNYYQVAQASLHCYLKSVDYEFKLVDLHTDKRVSQHCSHTQLFFRKHCAASVYLQDADWMLVLDADTGVVNPNHCIEEYIDERVDIIFYERFFNWEIASGNYLVRNTPFARAFLRRWADWQYEQPKNWNGADNGVLQIMILQTVQPESKQAARLCDKVWREGKDYDTYMRYVTCVRWALGAKRLWPGKLKLLRRAQGWVRDGFITNDKWCERDFMMHGWKANDTGVQGWQSPFEMKPRVDECEKEGEKGFHWRESHRLSTEDIRTMIANAERDFGNAFPKIANYLPFISVADIRDCWPDCDDE